ncbi:type III-A CRISPR-associated RAMP protein Csm5 [Persephonella atlantica]|uniref:CRISPR system Cms protein Csm5 n=1 Tax=Persephonella atlantica TaxID=2699429 RepID=A0ABS1GI96_9AQUI|nr:type III-A CRISPR-associated RAMP protein Csm5 [Persephonella atlantica]MBK3332632.1 type III-A CRISPR-associated RAMP protein Csm5 [Persephonella atlantica]
MKIEKKEIYKAETYKLETLSPVHIGTGNKYTNWDYYLGSELTRVYVLSLDRFIQQLSEKEQEMLADYIEKNSRKGIIDFVRGNKLDFRLLDNSKIYEIRLIDQSRFVHGIYEEIKHPEGLYIPASTIKGAIRTAVLYCLLKENKDYYRFSVKEFETEQGKKYKDIVLVVNGKQKKGIENIEEYLEREFFGENQSNDIFKYLRISDSYINKNFNNLECRKIYVANTTTFETVLPNGKKIRKYPEHYEIITEGTEFGGIEISVIDEEQLKRFIKPKYHKTLEKIKNWKQCLYEFSKDLIEAEIKFWETEDIENMIKKAYGNYTDDRGNRPVKYIAKSFNKKEVLTQLKNIQKENSPEEPVIRIGKLSGYLTHSIGLLLANNSGKPYDVHEFGKIINSKAKDWLFPLTKRLTLDNQTLGWCKLTFQKEIKNTKETQTKNNIEKENDIKNKNPDELANLLAKKWGGKFRK